MTYTLRHGIRLALTRSAILFSLELIACASKPLEQRYSAEQLRKMLETPPVCQARASNLSATPDWKQCAHDAVQERGRIREALNRLHTADIAAAPACVKNYHVPRSWFDTYGIDPDSKDAIPEFITRGGVIVTSENHECAAAVCAWRAKNEPNKTSPFCSEAGP
jgi:hypothetical protein